MIIKKFVKYTKKKEANTQRRTMKRIMDGIEPFGRSVCKKINKLDAFFVE
jgi:hypothetical protein